MKPKAFVVLLAAVFLGAGDPRAAMLSLALNNDAFDVRGGFHLGKDETAQLFLGGRYLHEDDEDSSYPAFLVAFVSRAEASEAVTFSVGLEVVRRYEEPDVDGIAIGGDIEWDPKKWKGLYGRAPVLRPEVFCFGDTERITSTPPRRHRINQKIRVFLRVLLIEARIAGGSRTVDDSLKLGSGRALITRPILA
jgi:hypothetical protein